MNFTQVQSQNWVKKKTRSFLLLFFRIWYFSDLSLRRSTVEFFEKTLKQSFFMFFLAFLMFVFRILNSPLLFLKLIFQSWIFVIDFYSFFGFLTGKCFKMANFDQKLVKINNTWNPFLLSFDNFSCFNKVELIRLISVFEFCSSRVAAASVWPKILENILKILLV